MRKVFKATLKHIVARYGRGRMPATTRAKGVDWQFTTDDARIKLKRLYPQV